MAPLALVLVLCSAVLHATWNALVKSSDDPWLRISMIMGSGGLASALALPFIGLPAPNTWPYILTAAFLHQVYFVGVCLGYRAGDLSHVYPIQRGVAPMLVAIASYVIIGEVLSLQGILGVSIISVAILSLALRGTRWPQDAKALGFALFTGSIIAAYTVVDGTGVRLSPDPLVYILWVFAVGGVPCLALVLFRFQSNPGAVRRHIPTGLLGGLLTSLAYGTAIWAMTLSPLTYVSAVRETSVIFAAWIGCRLLKEPFGRWRISAAAVMAMGVLILQTSSAS